MDKSLIILVKKPSLQQMLVEDNVNKPDLIDEDELMHFGILGMKWGVRRYQNKDGSLTALGKAHLATLRASDPKKAKKFEIDALKNTEIIKKQNEKRRKKSLKKAQKALKKKKYLESDAYKKKLEKKEEHKRKKNDKDFLKEFDPQKRKIIKRGPGAVERNIDMFTDREKQKIFNRYDWQDKFRRQKADKSQKRLDAFNRAIKTANNINDVIKIINSPIGKTVREMLGLDPNKDVLHFDPKYFNSKRNKRNNNRNNNQNNK